MGGYRTRILVASAAALIATQVGLADLVVVRPDAASRFALNAPGAWDPLARPTTPPAAEVAPRLEDVIPLDLEAIREARLQQLASRGFLDVCPGGLPGCPDLAAVLAGPDPAPEIITTLPASPSGETLALTGLLTIAGWQVGRSARNLRIASTTDWYHSTGPDRIGHAVAFDIDLATMPVCLFAEPTDHQPTIHRGSWDAFVPQLQPQCVLALNAPRSPPA